MFWIFMSGLMCSICSLAIGTLYVMKDVRDRKFERGNIKAEKNIALCRRCMKNAPSWWCPGERCYFFPYRKHVLFGDKKK